MYANRSGMYPVSVTPVSVPPPREERTYILRPGDTLRSIALAVYKNPLYARMLAHRNNITNINEVSPGTTIVVP